ncbi:hypothetical protein N7507_008770 [Penicillium longicatenatum]|nr:hypothetical protein N7507_008770 [Penicillium longicatenatum]
MCGSVSSLLALPLLCLISIPLIFSAWLTLSIALFTLLLRVSVVYLEVGYALIVNFFTLPASANSSSFLTFAPSESPTPAAGNSRRNSAHGLTQPHRTNDALSSLGLNGFQDDHSTRKSKKSYARSMIKAHDLPTAPLPANFIGFPVSGDKRRDFEGVGGWRSYPDVSSRASKPRSIHSGQEKPLSSSSSSTHSLAGEIGVGEDIDADERAWLSLNHRLELPSRVVTFGPGSTAPSNVTSPVYGDSVNVSSNALTPLFSTGSYDDHVHYPSGRRHHHRSHTTSALTTSDLRTGTGLALSLSTRPDQSSRPVSPSSMRRAPYMTPQSFSPSQTRPSMRSLPASGVPHTTGHILAGSSHGAGGYFALSRPGGMPVPNFSTVVSPSSSGRTTPGTEDYNSSSQLTRFIAHYPTSVRHRRRTISGPHARRLSMGDRQA